MEFPIFLNDFFLITRYNGDLILTTQNYKKMDNLNRNRLIGGGVLLLAGLLFVPAILTPTQHPLSNPDFPVSSNVIPKVVVNQTQVKPADESSNNTEVITLASADNSQPTKTKQPTEVEKQTPKPNSDNKKELVSVKLESFDTKKPEKTDIKVTKPNKQESWVRVASFSNLANADELVAQLKRKNYPVKIENIKIKGKPYRRVLLGPYASEKEMRSVLNQIQKEGFSPDVQR